ncbi:MAG: hypothetical protein QM680_04190 [Luteolibacter sp.]
MKTNFRPASMRSVNVSFPRVIEKSSPWVGVRMDRQHSSFATMERHGLGDQASKGQLLVVTPKVLPFFGMVWLSPEARCETAAGLPRKAPWRLRRRAPAGEWPVPKAF